MVDISCTLFRDMEVDLSNYNPEKNQTALNLIYWLLRHKFSLKNLLRQIIFVWNDKLLVKSLLIVELRNFEKNVKYFMCNFYELEISRDISSYVSFR